MYMMSGQHVMKCGCCSEPSALIRRLSEHYLHVRPEVIELSPISEDGRSRTVTLNTSVLVSAINLVWQPSSSCFSCSLPARHDDIMLEEGDFGCDCWEPYAQNPFGPLLRYLCRKSLAWSSPAPFCKWCWQSGAPLLSYDHDPEFFNKDFLDAYMQLLWPGENATQPEDAGKLYWSGQRSLIQDWNAWADRNTEAWKTRGQAWRARGLTRPRRDLADWLALLNSVEGMTPVVMFVDRRVDFRDEALAKNLALMKSMAACPANSSKLPGPASNNQDSASSQRNAATASVSAVWVGGC